MIQEYKTFCDENNDYSESLKVFEYNKKKLRFVKDMRTISECQETIWNEIEDSNFSISKVYSLSRKISIT